MSQSTLLSRSDLAERWAASVRTIDRLRRSGTLPWVDLSAGRGERPIVRFSLDDIERYESKNRRDTPLEAA